MREAESIWILRSNLARRDFARLFEQDHPGSLVMPRPLDRQKERDESRGALIDEIDVDLLR